MTPSDVARTRPSSDVRGREYALAWTATVDSWLQGIWQSVFPDADNVSLLAVGGYGRRRLGPFSDLDLLLVHTGRIDAARGDRLW